MKTLDFRSDAATRPGMDMRAAMAAAEPGNDLLDRDPAVERLEQRVADLLDREAGLWTPTGTLANLVALLLHLDRGDRFLAPARAHVLEAELGGAAWLAGAMAEPLAWDGGPGRVTPMQVWRCGGSELEDIPRAALLVLENTFEAAGGACTPAREHRALVEQARARQLKVHLDGARLWHAAAALGEAPADLAWGVDTVSVSLCKGLGAPMGAILCGPRAAMAQARRLRRMLGGAVAKAGVMAAAGLVALDRRERLRDDHGNARALANGLRALGFRVEPPETNILLVPVPDAAGAVALLKTVRVLALARDGALRFITHADLDAVDVAAALARIEPIADRLVTTWEGDRPMV